MRFIINLGVRSTVQFPAPRRAARPGAPRPARPPAPPPLAFKPVNELLAPVYQILKLEAAAQPHLLGSSVFGYNDAYCRLQPFVRRWRAAAAAAAAAGAPPPVPHLVSADVTRAFDHVDIPSLLALAEPLLRSEQYLVLRYHEVAPSAGGLRVTHRRVAVAGGAAQVDFPLRAAQLAAGARGRVYNDQVVYERVTRQDALRLLRDHLGGNLVKLRRAWHRQARGIAQGSTLSTLLCCLYLGHVERACLAPAIAAAGAGAPPPPPPPPPLPLPPPHGGSAAPSSAAGTGPSRGRLTALAAAADSSAASRGPRAAGPPSQPPLLMRLVDDWLLVSPSLEVARGAARALMAGFPQHGVLVNTAKTRLSFALELDGGGVLPPGTWDAGDGTLFMKWCGLLVNAATLEVQADYTRYAGEHVGSALTLPLRRCPGALLPQKLCLYLRPKVHPLLLDPVINSPDTVRLNLYQAFLMGAMKFHCFVRAWPAPPGASVLLAAIEAGVGFVCALARPRRVAPTLRPEDAVACATQVPRAHVRCLGLLAFRRVLRRKHARYAGLLRALDEALEAPACARCAPQLAAATDPGRSLVFDAILY
jgi:telomerase reverse transcriptase